MTLDEEMAWEDYQGFPRPTRQPCKCSKCGKTFMTRDVYLNHECTPTKKPKSSHDIEREKALQKSLEELHKKMGVK